MQKKEWKVTKKYKEEIDGNDDQNIEENEDKDNKTTSDTSLNMFDDVEGDYSEIQVDKNELKKLVKKKLSEKPKEVIDENIIRDYTMQTKITQNDIPNDQDFNTLFGVKKKEGVQLIGVNDNKNKDILKNLNTYTECYPGTYEISNVAFDESDEEEDLMQMDSKKRLKRWDFSDDESWQAYESKREATPKAAFQFGVKRNEGRKTKKQKESKLKQQFKKIEKIFEDKGTSEMINEESKYNDENEYVSHKHPSYEQQYKLKRTSESQLENISKKQKLNNDENPFNEQPNIDNSLFK